jgi:hypothetical protein
MRQDIGAATKLAARLQRLISMSLSLSSAASSSSDGLCLPVPGRREQSAQHAGALTSHRLPSHRLPSHSLPSHHLTSHQRSFCVFTQAPAWPRRSAAPCGSTTQTRACHLRQHHQQARCRPLAALLARRAEVPGRRRVLHRHARLRVHAQPHLRPRLLHCCRAPRASACRRQIARPRAVTRRGPHALRRHQWAHLLQQARRARLWPPPPALDCVFLFQVVESSPPSTPSS